jgi:hypothetical protein
LRLRRACRKPGIDASAACLNGTQAATTSYTLSCSTTSAGDIFVVYCRTVQTGAAVPTCTPSATGLTAKGGHRKLQK